MSKGNIVSLTKKRELMSEQTTKKRWQRFAMSTTTVLLPQRWLDDLSSFDMCTCGQFTWIMSKLFSRHASKVVTIKKKNPVLRIITYGVSLLIILFTYVLCDWNHKVSLEEQRNRSEITEWRIEGILLRLRIFFLFMA